LHEAKKIGTLIVANEQSEGRGRSGNGFLSKKGGVYFSLVLPHDASDGVLLTLAAAAAVAQTSQNAVKNPEDVKIKWVNDVYYRGRKLAGILTERLLDKIVIGIGVNFFSCRF
jgi:birA, biotin-[acetyl-CoA-carboxylase] ligase region